MQLRQVRQANTFVGEEAPGGLRGGKSLGQTGQGVRPSRDGLRRVEMFLNQGLIAPLQARL